MIEIKQTIEIDGVKHDATSFKVAVDRGDFSMRAWKEMLRDMWEFAGRFWHRFILPKHFLFSAYAEYGYQKRKVSYEIQKARKWGHKRPLVWSGRMERDVKRIQDVRANTNQAVVVLHGPKHLFAYRKDLGAADKAAELRKFSAADAELIAKVMDRRLQRSINARKSGDGSRTPMSA